MDQLALWSECCIVICMQPSGIQSEQEIESAERVDAVDQEREKLRLERKAFRKDHEMVGNSSAPSITAAHITAAHSTQTGM